MSFSVLLSMCLLACALEEDPESKPLLDEVVAGAEANLAMIQFGSATYKVEVERTVDPADPNGPIRETFDASIEFDGGKAHWRFKSINCLRDEQSDVIFDTTPLQKGVPIPGSALVATVYPRGAGHDQPTDYNPRYVGQAVGSGRHRLTVVDVIRIGRASAKVRLHARDAGDQIVVTELFDGVKTEYTVDRTLGYSLVRMQSWMLKIPERPATEFEAQYERADNGAYVATRASSVRRRPLNGSYVDASKRTLILEKAELAERPASDRFTLAALDLPVGTNVLDKSTGKRYLFGVDAVTDEEIERAAADIQEQFVRKQSSASGRSSGRNVAILFACGALALLSLILFWAVRRRRRE